MVVRNESEFKKFTFRLTKSCQIRGHQLLKIGMYARTERLIYLFIYLLLVGWTLECYLFQIKMVPVVFLFLKK